MKIVATTSLPAVDRWNADRWNADRWNAARSRQFLVLVRGNFFLNHLEPYLNGFILSHGFKFWGAPFMVKN